MRLRQITTHGWCVEDDLRADRIAAERAALAPGATVDEEALREREVIRPPGSVGEDLRPVPTARDG